MKLGTIILALMLTTSFAQAKTKVIYGEDNRLDIFETVNPMHLELAQSTAAMISRNSMDTDGDVTTITGSTLADRGICASERFAEQLTAANCSGFLVGPDLLVTAGHCITSQADCRNSDWVFGFAVTSGEQERTSFEVKTSDVYSCKEILERDLSRSNNNDYALIRLDRKVTDRQYLTVRSEGKVEQGTEIVVIGHPTGLPTKVADGAIVRNNSNSIYFSANLDTYGGNSGSAVFNAETGTVEGILVRGENDYVYDSSQGCRVSNRCADTGCRGEDVTRITNIRKLMDMVAAGEL